MSADTLTCAVCGQRVHPDDDHTMVEMTHKRPDDEDAHDDYMLHDRCQQAVFAGWRSP